MVRFVCPVLSAGGRLALRPGRTAIKAPTPKVAFGEKLGVLQVWFWIFTQMDITLQRIESFIHTSKLIFGLSDCLG
jgi:hypothetical protein